MQISLDKLDLTPEIKERIVSWLSPEFDPDTRSEIEKLVSSNDIKSLTDRFFRDLEFGTGGLRGIMQAGTNRMNRYTVMMATQGLANYIIAHSTGNASIAIAFDSRNNSVLFAEETALVMAGNGIKVHIFEDLRPTPVLSFAVRHLGTIAGINITASHNPKEYNGYKVYWNDGAQIISPQDEAIIAEVKKIKSMKEVRTITKAEALRKKLLVYHGKDIDKPYLARVKKLSLNPGLIRKTGSKLKIVYTPLHGSGYRLVPESLKNFGFKNVTVVKEQAVIDGNFPTVRSPNPEETDAMNLSINLAKSINAGLVLATDPDCDRLGIAVPDGSGEFLLLNGNQLGSILVYYILTTLKEKKAVKKDPFVVKTVVTTDLVQNICDHFGIKLYNVLTGFKFIAAIIREKKDSDFIFGFEESYGFLSGDFVRDKDGVIASSLTAEAAAWAADKGLTLIGILDEIYSKFGYYEEKQKSIVFEGKEGVDKMKKIMSTLESTPLKEIEGRKLLKVLNYKNRKAVETFPQEKEIPFPYDVPVSDVLALYYENELKITIRPSGTEPKIKFYISLRREDKSKDLPALKKETKDILTALSDVFTAKVKSLAG
jgi:phosphoglucomutase